MTHTPAPWTYSGGEVLDAQGNLIASLYDSFRHPDEDNANGPLLAAAPELLARLKAMVLNDTHTYRDCHKAALEVIAKAEGRS